jgi:hypothetical protein
MSRSTSSEIRWLNSNLVRFCSSSGASVRSWPARQISRRPATTLRVRSSRRASAHVTHDRKARAAALRRRSCRREKQRFSPRPHAPVVPTCRSGSECWLSYTMVCQRGSWSPASASLPSLRVRVKVVTRLEQSVTNFDPNRRRDAGLRFAHGTFPERSLGRYVAMTDMPVALFTRRWRRPISSWKTRITRGRPRCSL